MNQINFDRTYQLDEKYESAKASASKVLNKYLGSDSIFKFNDLERKVTYSTERLIPVVSTPRPRVLLLFSNPHPHSIQQGMFLLPNSTGQESLFWPVMESAGWLAIPQEKRTPELLADICLNVKYSGPFELIFHCYYAFPTDYPEDIKKIFGREYFSKTIEPQAMDEFRQTIEETSVKAVVTFNKGIFNRVSENPLDRYVKRLMAGELIQSQVKGIGKPIPIFLTFPTGWRYHAQYMEYRKDSLERIRSAISTLHGWMTDSLPI